MTTVKWRPFSHFPAWMYNCILKLTPSSFKSVAAPANSGFSVLQKEHPECKKKNIGPFNQHWITKAKTWKSNYRKVSNISRTLVGNKIVDNSDVVGASPVGVAPTTSSFST